MADVYLKQALLTDKVAVPFKTNDTTFWTACVTYADTLAVDLAEQLGILEADIATPIHTAFNDYLTYAFYERLFLEASGVNEEEEEKYLEKAGIYEGKKNKAKIEVTPEIITKTVCDRGDRVMEVQLFRS